VTFGFVRLKEYLFFLLFPPTEMDAKSGNEEKPGNHGLQTNPTTPLPV